MAGAMTKGERHILKLIEKQPGLKVWLGARACNWLAATGYGVEVKRASTLPEHRGAMVPHMQITAEGLAELGSKGK